MATTLLQVGSRFRSSTQISKKISARNSPNEQLGGIRNIAGLKEVSKRIKTVKTVQKITKTMKMISTVRLKEAQTRVITSRPFSANFKKLEDEMAERQKKKPSKESNLPGKLKTLGDTHKDNTLISICTDRGLCGSINTQTVKYCKNLLRNPTNEYGSVVSFGNKGYNQLSREFSSRMALAIGDAGKKSLNFSSIALAAEKIVQVPFIKATIVYNTFKTAMTFLLTEIAVPSYITMMKKARQYAPYEMEDAKNELRDLSEYQLAAVLNGAILENGASEVGARMSAMDSATRNAEEMIKKLTLLYNRKRQAGITIELIEITSGATSIEEQTKKK